MPQRCITKIAALQIEKATLGRDKQHPEEENEIKVPEVAVLRNISRLDPDSLREALRSSEHERDTDEETHAGGGSGSARPGGGSRP